MDILKKLKITQRNSGGCTGHNEWLDSKLEKLDSFNPSSNRLIASVTPCSNKEYEQIRDKSHQAFLKWREVPAPKRGEFVRRVGEALRNNKDALGSLVSLEMGKIKQEGDGEVQEMIDMADFAVGQSRMLYGKTMHSEREQHRMYEQWHPLGIVGVISAFNFPVAVWAWNAFIAVICGNTVIWKPSSKTPLCAIAVQHICNQVMHEMGYTGILSLYIPENRKSAELMVNDRNIALISFTGSSHTGKGIALSVTQRLGRYLLEMSGNNAIIVDSTANMDLAIPAIVFGAVGTAGQRCTSTRRIIVEASIADELCNRLVNACQQIKTGDPLAEGTLLGPLIDQNAVKEYLSTIKAATSLGGKIIHGGEAIKGEGNYVQPTIIRAESHWDIVQQETFSPILYITTFTELSQAIDIQNNVSQGLSSAMFTRHIQHAEAFLSASGSDCGIANINIGTSGAEIGGAFGGEKETGGGREAGSDSWKAYMRRQTCTINWSQELPLAQGITFKI